MDSQNSEVRIEPDARIQEEIRRLGFEPQNKKLMEMGFKQLALNLKYLKKHQGNIQLVISKLTEKKSNSSSDEDQPFTADNEEVVSPIQHELCHPSHTHNYPEPKHRKPHYMKEYTPKIELKEYNEWPFDIERVYVDGNNILFVEDGIRKLAISNRKREAQKLLSDLCFQFTSSIGTFDIILVFDYTTLTFNEKISTHKRLVNFSVVSAGPNFKSSDDALVHWAESLGGGVKSCLFVTADRELQMRLMRVGVEEIMRPKKWFSLIKSILGEASYRSIVNSKH